MSEEEKREKIDKLKEQFEKMWKKDILRSWLKIKGDKHKLKLGVLVRPLKKPKGLECAKRKSNKKAL